VEGSREYVGFIWKGDDERVDIKVVARSLEDARAQVEEKYGEGYSMSLWNEEDAAKPR